MHFHDSPSEAAFRQELRSWLQANLPAGWGTPGFASPHSLDEKMAFSRQWEKQLYEAGWSGLTWPKEWGGRGATLMEQVIYNEEMARARAPLEVNRMGKYLLGPTLIHHGTEEQKRRFLPPILRGEEIWCQGFSEPNAGSDLAALRTRAVREGDKYIVNGQKIWTSYAQHADWCFMLVRTEPDAPKHKGIGFLLVDMKAPGITVRPIVQITGDTEFSELFIDNVAVPVANLLGGPTDGWAIANTALSHERGTVAIAKQVQFRIEFDELAQMARQMGPNGRPAAEDPVIRTKLGRAFMEVEVMRLNGYRALTRQLRGHKPGPEGSIAKLYWSHMYQRMTELAMEIQGNDGQLLAEDPAAVDGGAWQYRFLKSRGDTIHSGTSEIQRNIIAERVLGLPR